MAIIYSGDIDYKPDGTVSAIGDTSSGALLVDNGSIETYDATINNEPILVRLGAAPTGDGTVTITGLDSTLKFVGVGSALSGMNVGNSGTGELNITAGGSLIMEAVPTPPEDSIGVSVARFAGKYRTGKC